MVDQVNAAVYALVIYLGVVGDVGMPLRRVIANEVVAHAGLLVEADGVRRGISTDDPHADDVACVALLQREHGLGGCQKQLVAGTARQEVDSRIALSLVGFEAQGELAVGGTQLGLIEASVGVVVMPTGKDDRQRRSSRASRCKPPARGNVFSEHHIFSH